MTPFKGAPSGRLLVTALAAVVLTATGAYFGWWKPLVLASLRFSIETAIKRSKVPVNFESLDLHGINTIVIKNLAMGSLEDPDSAVIREARLSFSIFNLLAGRFDFIKGLTSITLVQPQFTLAVPRKEGRPLPPIPYAPNVGIRIKEGKILLRRSVTPPVLCAFADIDLAVRSLRGKDHEFRIRFTPPGSGKRSFSAHGLLKPDELDISVDTRDINFAPLSQWAESFGLPSRLSRGKFSSSLRVKLTRTPGGDAWAPVSAWGKVDLDQIEIARSGLPFPVSNLTGRVQFNGLNASINRMNFKVSSMEWTAQGTVSNISTPVFNLDLQSASFDLSHLAKEGKGRGTCKVALRGTASALEVTIEPDLSGFAWNGVSLPTLKGRFRVLEQGRMLRFDPAISAINGGVITLKGQADRKNLTGEFDWLFEPVSRAVPAWKGNLRFDASRASFAGGSADGRWKFSGKAVEKARTWRASINGRNDSQARISGEVSLRPDTGRTISGDIIITGATPEDFYLQAIHPLLGRVHGTIVTKAAVRGTCAKPLLNLAMNGQALSLEDFHLPASADVRISQDGVSIPALKVSTFASARLSFPFGRKPGSAGVSLSGAPLSFVRLFVSAPEWSRNINGDLHGEFEARNIQANPLYVFTGSLKRFSWKGKEYGQVEASVEGTRTSLTARKIGIKGPALSAEGNGRLSAEENGWRADGQMMLAYLKMGRTDVEAKTRFKGGGRKGTGSVTAELTSIRLNGSAYPDARLDLALKGTDEVEARLSWEDLFSGVASLRDADGKTLAVTAAFTELPLSALVGLLNVPSPVDRISGSVKIKGPRDRAVLDSSLSWRRGEAEISGIVNTLYPGEFSINLTMVETGLSAWLPVMRTIPGLKEFPEINGRFETRSLSLARSKGVLVTNGWTTLRELKINDQDAGRGSLRIAQDGETTELEASVEGPFGDYLLYPTRITTGGGVNKLEGAFSWKNAPAGKAAFSCLRGTLAAEWTGRREADIRVVLADLSINDQSLKRLAVQLHKTGDSYSVSSAKNEDWQTMGTISIKDGKFEIMPDDRCAGSWLIFRKLDGATAKISGKWRFPALPERAGFEGHLLPARPILLVLGMPPTEGAAEADLSWNTAVDPPVSGRLSLIKGEWNGFPFDVFEGRLSGTPGRRFDFTSLKVRRVDELAAAGTGSIELFPERRISFRLEMERLVLSYLKPLGILKDSDVVAKGVLTLSGSPDDPQAHGSLVCAPGSVNPRTGFTLLQLTEGRLDFDGKEASLSANLNDIAGAPVLVSGNARLSRLLPETFVLSLSAPNPVKIDALPRLYKGTIRGNLRFEGKPAEPQVTGDVLLEEGQIKSPPSPQGEDLTGLACRLSWDLMVRFGRNVQYVIDPLGGAAFELARISPESSVKIRGKGENFRVYGNVTADEGPLTLFLGKQIWKNEPGD